jgi:hypothetical protein
VEEFISVFSEQQKVMKRVAIQLANRMLKKDPTLVRLLSRGR